MKILHISAEFPDVLSGHKTCAISNLIHLTPELDHWVYSLSRVGWLQGIHALTFQERHRAVCYGAPPKGILHKSFLDRLARWIIADIETRKIAPDIIHAHKLSIEGLCAEKVAKHLGKRLVISCQGDSDLKIIRFKPSLRRTYQRIWREADLVLPFAPWTESALSQLLGPRKGPTEVLPCPGEFERWLEPVPSPRPIIRSLFHLSSYRRKNATILIRASAIAAEKIPNLMLEIGGGGDPRSFAEVSRLAKTLGAGHVRLVGPLDHASVPAFLNEATALILPSKRESFGMVFSEALMAGCPVVHGKGSGIDGYFAGASFARPVNVKDASSVASVIVEMVFNENEIKEALLSAQKDGILNCLQRESIRECYLRSIGNITKNFVEQKWGMSRSLLT